MAFRARRMLLIHERRRENAVARSESLPDRGNAAAFQEQAETRREKKTPEQGS
jgi:hypothetical protein